MQSDTQSCTSAFAIVPAFFLIRTAFYSFTSLAFRKCHPECLQDCVYLFTSDREEKKDEKNRAVTFI